MKAVLIGLLILTSTAHAAYFAECGKGLKPSQDGFNDVVFSVSSEDDHFTGRNGDEWSLSFGQDVWLPRGKAQARVLTIAGKSVLEVVVAKDHGMQMIGKRYVISPMYNETPVLSIYNVGGFAGGVKIAEYPCLTFID